MSQNIKKIPGGYGEKDIKESEECTLLQCEEKIEGIRGHSSPLPFQQDVKARVSKVGNNVNKNRNF